MHGDLQQQLNYGACWTGTASSEPDSPPLTKQAAGCSAGECTASVCVCVKKRACVPLKLKTNSYQKPQFKQRSPF